MQRFFLHDFGFINALGNDKASIVKNWQLGVSPGMVKTDGFFKDQPSTVGLINAALPDIPEEFKKHNSKNNQLLLIAFEQIQESYETLKARVGSARIAIVLGTSTSGIANTETALDENIQTGHTPDSYDIAQQCIGSGADFLQQYLQLSGPAITVSTACSSSGNAFATARRLINSGFCDAAIVGGADSLCQMTVQGFSALNSVSAELCQPFSENRCGINIGEGAALFLLSSEPDDIELYAVGCSSDAHHISAPEPNGKGAIAAMENALEQTVLSANQIDYINLHGTATPLNDSMESTAINFIFSDNTLCSSTKSLTGHTLGAAAATELALCASLLKFKFNLPKQVWDGKYDPEFAGIKIANSENTQQTIKVCMSNSFAFGGNNTSLIIGQRHETL